MSNFAASPVNSTFDIAFVQHEPGSLCTTLMDKPFSQNLDECLRYFCKSYELTDKPGALVGAGMKQLYTGIAAPNAFGTINYPKILAKNVTPTVMLYNYVTGQAGLIRYDMALDYCIMLYQIISVTPVPLALLELVSQLPLPAQCKFIYTTPQTPDGDL